MMWAEWMAAPGGGLVPDDVHRRIQSPACVVVICVKLSLPPWGLSGMLDLSCWLPRTRYFDKVRKPFTLRWNSRRSFSDCFSL
jgi:hypothetical protein